MQDCLHKHHCSNTIAGRSDFNLCFADDIALQSLTNRLVQRNLHQDCSAAVSRQYWRGSEVTCVSQLSTAYLDHLYSLSFHADVRRGLLSMLRKTHFRLSASGICSHLLHGAQIQRIYAKQGHIPGGLARLFIGNCNVCQ